MTRLGLNNLILQSAWIKTYEKIQNDNQFNSFLIYITFSMREYIGSPSVIRKYKKPIINAVQCRISGIIYTVNTWPHSVVFFNSIRRAG